MSEKKQEAKTTEDITVDQTTDVVADAPVVDNSADDDSAAESASGARFERAGSRADGDKGDRRNPRRARRNDRRGERQKPEFDQKIISIRRVTRVMAGGRRFSFSVAMVIGDKKGKVGVGIGKAGDTQLAIEKAARNAKKNLFTVPVNKDMHIPHDVQVKYASSEVMIMPAPGRGLVAGSSVRTVLELAGVKDVTAKVFSRSKNKLNNARAAILALKQLRANSSQK